MNKSLKEIAKQLHDANKKVQLIYAFNGSGKTRLSREFKELLQPKSKNEEDSAEDLDDQKAKVIYYNAFTEDLFYWDNDLENDVERKLKIQPNGYTDWVFKMLKDQGLDQNIVSTFQRYADEKLMPNISDDFSEVTFSFERGDNQSSGKLKISKGEESNFIWSVFYSLLELAVGELSSATDERSTEEFNNLEYVFIDDPVSSLDDNHLIELAVDLAKLVKSSSVNLKFIITTHNPLFYNVLSNEFNNKLAKDPTAETIEWIYKPNMSQKSRLDKKADGTFALTELKNKTPFSYHLLLLSEVNEAIDRDQIKKYHFSFLRNILEKTATFLGYKGWEELLPKAPDGNPDPFTNRILNLSSHSAHAGEETGEVSENDKQKLGELVRYLSNEYKFCQHKTNETLVMENA